MKYLLQRGHYILRCS